MVETRVPPPTAIEAIAPGEVDKDEFTTTSDFDSTSLLESTTSQTSSVYHHSFENGRRVSGRAEYSSQEDDWVEAFC